eukprot:1184653-Prorocentrum_minimum.AAC.1
MAIITPIIEMVVRDCMKRRLPRHVVEVPTCVIGVALGLKDIAEAAGVAARLTGSTSQLTAHAATRVAAHHAPGPVRHLATSRARVGGVAGHALRNGRHPSARRSSESIPLKSFTVRAYPERAHFAHALVLLGGLVVRPSERQGRDHGVGVLCPPMRPRKTRSVEYSPPGGHLLRVLLQVEGCHQNTHLPPRGTINSNQNEC